MSTDQTQDTTQTDETQELGPDWNVPSSVVQWFGGEIISIYRMMRKTKAETRLHKLSQGLDTWTRLYKLASETSELAELRAELDGLRAELEAQKLTGPTGVVRQ